MLMGRVPPDGLLSRTTTVWFQAAGIRAVCRMVFQSSAKACHQVGGSWRSASAVQWSPPPALPLVRVAARWSCCAVSCGGGCCGFGALVGSVCCSAASWLVYVCCHSSWRVPCWSAGCGVSQTVVQALASCATCCCGWSAVCVVVVVVVVLGAVFGSVGGCLTHRRCRLRSFSMLFIHRCSRRLRWCSSSSSMAACVVESSVWMSAAAAMSG